MLRVESVWKRRVQWWARKIEVSVPACDYCGEFCSFQRALLQIILFLRMLLWTLCKIKVSFFFAYTKAQKHCGNAHQNAEGSSWGSARREDRKREVKRGRGSEKPLLPGWNTFPGLKMGLIPLCPVVLPHFGRPLPSCTEETASYLHQITFLYTPPHWPYHEEYPESGAQRSHSHRPRPFRVSVKRKHSRVRRGRSKRWTITVISKKKAEKKHSRWNMKYFLFNCQLKKQTNS